MSAFVAIDIGNTHTTIGWWDEDRWKHEWRLTTKAVRTRDEWTVILDGILRRGGFPDSRIQMIAISSVVPAMTGHLSFASEQLGLPTRVIGIDDVKSLNIAYEPASAVGPDRLCGVAAAIHDYGVPVIVVDLGTATVIDVVNESRTYLGGIIAPGVATAAESLHQSTALLPKAELAFPPQVVGRNTIEAIQSGILNGAIAMIDGLVLRIHQEYGPATVVATGGFAKLLEGQSATINHVNSRLVLDGIRVLATGVWS
ncbi:type III pantothenate kinase [bacterium]|nr:type III pantothenate kinase [bacterium]